VTGLTGTKEAQSPIFKWQSSFLRKLSTVLQLNSATSGRFPGKLRQPVAPWNKRLWCEVLPARCRLWRHEAEIHITGFTCIHYDCRMGGGEWCRSLVRQFVDTSQCPKDKRRTETDRRHICSTHTRERIDRHRWPSDSAVFDITQRRLTHPPRMTPVLILPRELTHFLTMSLGQKLLWKSASQTATSHVGDLQRVLLLPYN